MSPLVDLGKGCAVAPEQVAYVHDGDPKAIPMDVCFKGDAKCIVMLTSGKVMPSYLSAAVTIKAINAAREAITNHSDYDRGYKSGYTTGRNHRKADEPK